MAGLPGWLFDPGSCLMEKKGEFRMKEITISERKQLMRRMRAYSREIFIASMMRLLWDI